jgi:hypothetical protein
MPSAKIDRPTQPLAEFLRDRDPLAASKRYHVEDFDLHRKQTVIEASESYMPTTSGGIGGFCSLVNAPHYDQKTGQLVSELDVNEMLKTVPEVATDAYRRFVTANQALVGISKIP